MDRNETSRHAYFIHSDFLNVNEFIGKYLFFYVNYSRSPTKMYINLNKINKQYSMGWGTFVEDTFV